MFKILFLGTGAPDWPFRKYPGDPGRLFSGEFRGSSSILVNGKILVDCGPTVPAAMETFDVDLSRLSDILITHTHGDHFSLKSLETLAGRVKSSARPNLWMEQGALERAGTLNNIYNIHRLEPGKEVSIAGCSILPLSANHKVSSSPESPLHFLFSVPGKNFLYALDCSWLSTAAWRAIMNLQLDAIVWDGTIGDLPGDHRIFEHNSIPVIRLMNQTLQANGVYADSSRIILSHLARTMHPEHRELARNLGKEGMEPAYDGMVVKI
ncbi:MAG: MBL fold metallo-hydrolase [Acidobacteriota bacterium]